jgi:hypothetical protein
MFAKFFLVLAIFFVFASNFAQPTEGRELSEEEGQIQVSLLFDYSRCRLI